MAYFKKMSMTYFDEKKLYNLFWLKKKKTNGDMYLGSILF